MSCTCSVPTIQSAVWSAGEIWKRCFPSGNASNVFRAHDDGKIWKRSKYRSFGICCSENSVGEIARLSRRHHFRKAPFFICFHYSKTHIQGFQIPPVWRALFEKLRFRDGWMWTIGLVAVLLHWQITILCDNQAQ